MPRLIERAARIAYAFVVMNGAAVAGLARLIRGGRVWR
jgi:hypothetical protein